MKKFLWQKKVGKKKRIYNANRILGVKIKKNV